MQKAGDEEAIEELLHATSNFLISHRQHQSSIDSVCKRRNSSTSHIRERDRSQNLFCKQYLLVPNY
jgi:hypothetical protein